MDNEDSNFCFLPSGRLLLHILLCLRAVVPGFPHGRVSSISKSLVNPLGLDLIWGKNFRLNVEKEV